MVNKGKESLLRLKSFSNAFQGIYAVFNSQINFRIQLGFTLLALILGIFLSISVIEWAIVTVLIGQVLSLEAINTSLEILCDTIESGYSKPIKKVKDIAAAAVLVSSITSLIVGIIIFLPKLIILLNRF